MYLRNCWYVAAWSRDVGDMPVGRIVLDEPVVLYRKADGSIVALEDRCAHRHAPLHCGRVLGSDIQCGYHGLVFNEEGVCTKVPGQTATPLQARVRKYRALERYAFVWIWMGDPDLADPDVIPDFARMSDPTFAPTGAVNHVRAHYELLNDNLLDLSHVGYVHCSTIGTPEMGEKATVRTERTEHGIRVTRWVIDCAPPPTHVRSGIFRQGDRVDRWQIIDFLPPSFIQIHVGSAKTGTGAPEGNRVGGLGMWIMNAMTPETPVSTNYYWGVARDFQVHSPETTRLIFNEITTAFEEDKQILEAQQRSIELFAGPSSVNIPADAGGIQARRLLRTLIETQLAPA
ncbi:hypothetical protein XH98_11000 [Bradyrhizobium sp. CCBAU 51745]|uniref:aromatic ring-hydroxylating dioxygenase subunit alpha n=1 Tax=Bradyrhizobium sp. CCBAU 51745 TaxID=1325099 RepID=UPI0023062A8D|nr:aromatic ring-hydroxylating dioxygenase subunit alpha [Bradyrhizobium sp. CCBAU 51745]MDA9439646.1 hypothetical protein [Bradyrhizobium sp. CCBAU 51745]